MKRLWIPLLALVPALLPSPAAGVAISGIHMDPGSEAAVQWGDHVFVHYDYTVDLPEGARVCVRPYSQGAVSPHYIYLGAQFYEEGSGSGYAYFTIQEGDVLVDELCFDVARGETGWPRILCFFVPVRYHFGANAITDVALDPTSPSCVMYGQHVDISFSYENNGTDPVLIFARPFTNGALTPGYSASGSPEYPPGSGEGTQWFTITGGSDVSVDHIRFQMKSATTGEVLLEHFVPCRFDFEPGSVGDIGFSHDSPYGLLPGEWVDVSFEYHTVEPGGVRVFLLPYTNGSATPGYLVSGSPLYPVGTGTGNGSFTITSGEQTIDHLLFKMTNADQSVTLFEYFVPVSYHYAADVVRQILLQHPSPAYFTLDHPASMDLPYTVDEPAGVLIWSLPRTGGSPTPNGTFSGSPVWPNGDGTATSSVFVSDEPAVIDQLRLLMMDPDQTRVLMSWFVDVELHYGDEPSAADVEPAAEAAPPATLFTPFASPLVSGGSVRWTLPSDADVRLRLFDVLGRERGLLLQEKQAAGAHACAIEADRHGLARGVYFLRLEARPEEGREPLRDQRKVILLR